LPSIFDNLDVERRLDHHDLAAVLRNWDVAPVAELRDLPPVPFGVACAARLHGVHHDVFLLGERDHLRIFHVLRVVHVRRRIAYQEHDAADVGALAPGQLVDRDVERFVDAFRPVAAAARLEFEQIGVEVLDVGGEVEFLRHIIVADVAVGDEAHADFGVGIGLDDRGRDRPDFPLGALDQTGHGARGVEDECDLDNGPGGGRRRRQRNGKDKKRKRQQHRCAKHDIHPS
jgi:hypothetical protein